MDYKKQDILYHMIQIDILDQGKIFFRKGKIYMNLEAKDILEDGRNFECYSNKHITFAGIPVEIVPEQKELYRLSWR